MKTQKDQRLNESVRPDMLDPVNYNNFYVLLEKIVPYLFQLTKLILL